MTKKAKKFASAGVSVVMSCLLAFTFAACGGETVDPDDDTVVDTGSTSDGYHTLYDYTSTSPSNWNVLTYTDSNDTQIMDYIHSYFFEFDYDFGGEKYDSDGNILSENIVDGSYEVHYSAATKVEDVTADVASAWGYSASQVSDGGYAWKITLRDDLCWDDGTAITADDFVYSMKEQLNPEFYNYRADSYYNSSVVIHNAQNYLYQGTYNYANMISTSYGDDEYIAIDDLVEDATTGYLKTVDGEDVMINLSDGGNWGSYGIATYYNAYASSLFADIDYTVLSSAATNSDGYTYVTKAVLEVLNEMIALLHGYSSAAAYYAAEGDYAYLEWEEFCYLGSNYAEMDFSEVGIYAESDTELVIVLDSPLYLLKDDGSLSYRAAYYLSNLPLVKEDLYEDCKVDNSSSGAYNTSIYCSNKATTASWGPYKLTYFQSGKQYILEKNENWYGWDLEEYQNQYQTDRIVCDTMSDSNTIWSSFMIGNIDSVGISSEHSEYSSSSYAMFTPSSYTHSLQVQTTYSDSMASNNSAILLNQNFRKAISLGINRSEFTQATTTASQAGYGVLNSMYYYAVDDGLTYRGSNAAKEALLETYGFYLGEDGYWTDGTNVYASLDDAYDAITGYDLAQAQELVKTAITEMENGTTDYSMYTWYTDGTYTADDIVWDSSKDITIEIVVSTASGSTTYDLMLEYLQQYFDAITEGTALEGKITLKYREEGSGWSNNFRAGTGDLCMGGWSGAAWDPGYMLLAYLDSSYMYSYSWDTSSQMLKLTMPDGDYAEAGQEITMSLYDWYLCLNGNAGDGAYNWASGNVDDDVRLFIIAALEKEVLSMYYSIPIYYSYSATLHSAKINYISYEYNTFMSYGGLRYITYNYTDDEWTAFVASQGGNLESLYKS